MREAVFDLTDDSDDDFRCEIQVPDAAAACPSFHAPCRQRLSVYSDSIYLFQLSRP